MYLGKASTKPSSDLEGEVSMFPIWSNALLHELTVLDTLSVASVFSREERDSYPELWMFVQCTKERFFITFDYFMAQVEIKDVRVLCPYVRGLC